VNGKSVSLPSGDSAIAAIDTGTTLIGGPTAAVDAIWGAVSGSQALTGNLTGYFAFRTFFSSSPGALRHGFWSTELG
jgi:cathepsin D